MPSCSYESSLTRLFILGLDNRAWPNGAFRQLGLTLSLVSRLDGIAGISASRVLRFNEQGPRFPFVVPIHYSSLIVARVWSKTLYRCQCKVGGSQYAQGVYVCFTVLILI